MAAFFERDAVVGMGLAAKSSSLKFLSFFNSRAEKKVNNVQNDYKYCKSPCNILATL